MCRSILCGLDGIVEKDEVSLEVACRKYLSLYSEEELKSKYTFSMNLPHLIDALQDTIRYGNIKLKNYKKVYSDEDVIQFSVVTLVLQMDLSLFLLVVRMVVLRDGKKI